MFLLIGGLAMLNIGDKVFIPNYGAGFIDKIEEKKIYDTLRIYIGVSLLLDNIYLLIPSTKLEDYRIRLVSSYDFMDNCLKIIQEEPEKIQEKWGKRYRENNDKIYSGDCIKLCEVLRDLYYLKKQDLLPKGELKILQRAESMLESEISLVYNITMEEACNKLQVFS